MGQVACVLIVEDDPIIGLDLQRELLARGRSVMGPAFTVAHALAVLRSSKIDAAILDIHLINETSVAVADDLVERHIPFLFVTGHSSAMLPVRHQGRPFFTKPFSRTELFEAVDELLGSV